MPHATLPSPGLHAFILCGPGASLSTFTSNPKDFSKALVPIANRPMVWYPLDWCYRMGITDITLIVPPESKYCLEVALATHPALTSLPNPRPDVLSPKGLDLSTATAQLLRLPEVQRAIISDFLLLPCDLISELDGTQIIQQWMTLNPLPTTTRIVNHKGGLSVFYPTYSMEGIGDKKEATDFLATVPARKAPITPPDGSIRPDIETVVMAMPTDTLNDKIEERADTFKIRAALSHKYGRVKIRTKYRDAHIYVFPKWVKNYVMHAGENEKFVSVSEDAVGWWAKAQWQTGLGEKIGMGEALQGYVASPDDDLAESLMLEDEADVALLSTTRSTPRAHPLQSTSLASRAGGIPLTPAKPLQIPSFLAYIQPPAATPSSQCLIRRVDTTPALLGISLYLAKQPLSPTNPLSHSHKVHPTARLGPQSRVAQEDSLIAENVNIGTRTIIKESVVGANCAIGNNVRLTRCLLMDGVSVGDGVQMVGCVVGRWARLEGMPPREGTEKEKSKGKGRKDDDEDEGRTKLVECEVAPNFVVEAGTEKKGEQLSAFVTEGDMDEYDDDDNDEDDSAEVSGSEN